MRFRSVLGAFLFILLASSIAMLVFIQTESFGNLITKIVSDLTQKRTKAKIKISHLAINLYPLGIELNKIEIKKIISETESVEAELGKIGFYINFFEFEERRFSLAEIKISDSIIKYTSPKKEEEIKEIEQEVIDAAFDFADKSPIGINTLLVENAKININHDLVEAKRLKIFKKSNSFIARFHLANLKPKEDLNLKIDEAWGDVEIFRKDIKIYRLKIQHDVQTFIVKGNVDNFRLLKGCSISLNGEGYFHLRSLADELNIQEKIRVEDGFGKLAFNINYKELKISGKSSFELENLKSNVIHADKLYSNVEVKDEKIILNDFELSHESSKLNTIGSIQIYDLSSHEILPRPLRASLKGVTLTNILRFIPSLSSIKGELTGQLEIKYRNKDIHFLPEKNFSVRNLGLILGSDDPFKLLMVERLRLKESEFSIVNNEFQMSAAIETNHSKFEVDGFVNKNEVRFHVPESVIDLEDFGNIANLDIKGKGPLSIDVSGPLDDTSINIKGKTIGFEILGYRLGESEKDISIVLKDSSVIIKKLEALIGQTHLSGTGLVNYKTAEIALGIHSNDVTFNNLEQIIHPILSEVTFLPDDLNLKAKIDVDIFGKYRFPELKVRSKVDFTDFVAYGENFNKGTFKIFLANEILSFRDLKAEKGNGGLFGDFYFGLKDQKMNINYSWSDIELSSLNIFKKSKLNFNSNLRGSLYGSGTTKNYKLKLRSKLTETRTQNYNFADSDVSINILPGRLDGKLNLANDFITSDFKLYLNNKSRSSFNLKIFAPELKPYAVAVFGPHLESENFSSKFNFSLSSSFDQNFKNLDATASLNEFNFEHQNFNLKYKNKKPEFLVKNDQVLSWNLMIKQPDIYLVTNGKGKFGKDLSLIHEVQLNSKILEILLAPIQSSEGFLQAGLRIGNRGSEYIFTAMSKSSELNFAVEGLPIPINKFKYDIKFSEKRLLIDEMSASLDPGVVSLKGDIFFDGDEPDVNLKYQLERAEIPILGKSSINLSGEGIVLGNQLPYNLSGEILINKALIVNELNEFESKSAALSQVRFLPKNQESVFSKLITLNMNIKAENPIRITNSLMDVALKGEVRVFGNPARPRGEGRLFSPVNSSRIFFKNSEYVITSADINFSPKKEISNPDFDIQAMTLISNYKVFPKAYGDMERFSFDLTSEPALTRNSILSLIAFGYSDEMQSNLRPEDQQNINQVGVGSFVFDRFKISDILNKQFGLQVNLGTVFEQSSTESLLAGRSQDGGVGQGALGRTRSATKIELKKRLDEALTLSVSSTMGGGIGQRQSMNLNYGLTKKVQLEGVYELRTNAEGEEDVIDNSIGADVKFRWTFK